MFSYMSVNATVPCRVTMDTARLRLPKIWFAENWPMTGLPNVPHRCHFRGVTYACPGKSLHIKRLCYSYRIQSLHLRLIHTMPLYNLSSETIDRVSICIDFPYMLFFSLLVSPAPTLKLSGQIIDCAQKYFHLIVQINCSSRQYLYSNHTWVSDSKWNMYHLCRPDSNGVLYMYICII